MTSKNKKNQERSRDFEITSGKSVDVISSKKQYLEKELATQQKVIERIISLLDQINASRDDPDNEALKKTYTLLQEYPKNLKAADYLLAVKSLEELSMSELTRAQISFMNKVVLEIKELEGLKLAYDDLLKVKRIANAIQLNEAKMIIVGQGEVGKTSLINRLLYNTFDPHQTKTEGISIKRWQIPVDNKEIRLNIWDFGGQEIMHATHQFFLTKRSLYLLVLAARKDEHQNNLEYWLKLIQSFGGDSPVIIVINKSEDGNLDLAKRTLQSKFSNIRAFVETSCITGDGISDLEKVISNVLRDLKSVHEYVDEDWIKIKDQLENMEKDYIDYKEYQNLCGTNGVKNAIDQRNLVRFLHDLGTILNFGFSETLQRLDVRLENTNVINPEWITNGVYAILNSSFLYQENGIIKLEQLENILDPDKYPKDKQIYIIEMMKKFELCFELAEERDKFLVIAGNLTKDEPDIRTWTNNNPLKFEFRYNFLPSSIISRFIVRMYQHKLNNLYWRTGIALKFQGNEALVKADLSESKIYIYIIGNQSTRRELLAIIRSELGRINSTIAQLEANEIVPYKGDTFEYEFLLQCEETGVDVLPLKVNGKIVRVNVKEILATIDLRQEIKKEVDTMQRNNPWVSGSFYLVAFVVVVAITALLAYYVSWIAVPLILIASLLGISIIGALQLRNDNRLKEANFLTLVIEFYKRLPLLKNQNENSQNLQQNVKRTKK